MSRGGPPPTPEPGEASGAPAPRSFVVEPGAAGTRLDRFLQVRAPDLSRTRLQALIATGRVRGDRRPRQGESPAAGGRAGHRRGPASRARGAHARADPALRRLRGRRPPGGEQAGGARRAPRRGTSDGDPRPRAPRPLRPGALRHRGGAAPRHRPPAGPGHLRAPRGRQERSRASGARPPAQGADRRAALPGAGSRPAPARGGRGRDRHRAGSTRPAPDGGAPGRGGPAGAHALSGCRPVRASRPR